MEMPLDVQMHCVRIGHDYPAPCVPWEPTQRRANSCAPASHRAKRAITPAAPARRSRHQPPARNNWRWVLERSAGL